MKKPLFPLVLLVAIFPLFLGCNTNNRATVNLKIKNCEDSVLIVHYFNFTDSIFASSKGNFIIDTAIKSPEWIKIQLGNVYCPLYLEPNIKIDIELDNNLSSPMISSNNKINNIFTYLIEQNELFKSHSCNKTSFIYENECATYIDSLNSLELQLKNKFDSFVVKFGKKYRYFCDTDKLRIQLLMAILKLNYGSFIQYSNELTIDEKNKYFNFLNDIDLSNQNYYKLPEFIDFALSYIEYSVLIETSKDDTSIKTDNDYMQFVFDLIKTKFHDKNIIERLYYNKLFEFLTYMGIENLESNYEEFKQLSTNQTHIANIENIFNKWKKLSNGLPAPKFSAFDVDGKEHNINEFLGNLIVIDVWASWCGPCKRENPYFEDLKKKFKNKPVVFISISVDENSENWIEEIEKAKMTGIQWFAQGWNNSLCLQYNINSIPRYILIDKDGNILNVNAARPSGDLQKTIEDYIKSLK